jgi:hypothetical protein
MVIDMMTDKQKWFISKLMKEIETMGYVFEGYETNYGSNSYDTYRTSKQEASEDIDKLIKIKDMMLNGKNFDEAYKVIQEAKKQEILKKLA